jgi:hypothetical protein
MPGIALHWPRSERSALNVPNPVAASYPSDTAETISGMFIGPASGPPA